MTDDQSHRLPRTVVPRHYRLRLEPDLEQAVFAGSAEVTVEVRERTERPAPQRPGVGYRPGPVASLRGRRSDCGGSGIR